MSLNLKKVKSENSTKKNNSVSKLIFIGMGGVGRTFLEMMPYFKIPKPYSENILIFEPRDLSTEDTVKMYPNAKVVQVKLTDKNLTTILNKYIFPYDIIIDVSYHVYFKLILEYCLLHNIMYINTSMERFPLHNEHILDKNDYHRTLHSMHNEAIKLDKLSSNKKATILLTHGMNPGLITHFAKLGIAKIAKLCLKLAKQNKLSNQKITALEKAYKDKNYALLAYILQLRAIHCSERDTQLSKVKRKSDTFMNTWGPYSFYSEGVDPIQIGWGTHEQIVDGKITLNNKKYPIHFSKSPDNIAFLDVRGVDGYAKSFVPVTDKKGELIIKKNNPKLGEITGMLISHSENDTANRAFSLYRNGKLIYRPSNYYVYSSCVDSQNSILDVKKNGYKMLTHQHALRGYEIAEGEDAVGALLIFESNPILHMLDVKKDDPIYWKLKSTTYDFSNTFWSGTILSIEETKDLNMYYSGPTTVQVGTSLLSALKWMLKHPKKGVLFPEDIPYDKILSHAQPWLGRVFCDFVPYKSSVQFQDIVL